MGQESRSIGSYRALLEMDPVDPAETYYRLARLLQKTDDLEAARRKVLESLEEAPRFRAALRLLLTIEHQLKEQSRPAEKQQNKKDR